MVSWKFRLPST